MKRIIKPLLLVCHILIFGNLMSQDCSGFHENSCDFPFDWDYEINTQTTNSSVFEGQTIRVSVILYSDMKYSILICPDEEMSSVSYRILDNGTELLNRTFATGYEDDKNYVEFLNTMTRKITIEVTMPRTQTEIDYDTRYCLGVIIGEKDNDDF